MQEDSSGGSHKTAPEWLESAQGGAQRGVAGRERRARAARASAVTFASSSAALLASPATCVHRPGGAHHRRGPTPQRQSPMLRTARASAASRVRDKSEEIRVRSRGGITSSSRSEGVSGPKRVLKSMSLAQTMQWIGWTRSEHGQRTG